MNTLGDDDVIVVPLRDGTNVIEIAIDELPVDVADVLDLLKMEHVALSVYHQFAQAYYRQDNQDAFKRLMQQGIAVTTDPATAAECVAFCPRCARCAVPCCAPWRHGASFDSPAPSLTEPPPLLPPTRALLQV